MRGYRVATINDGKRAEQGKALETPCLENNLLLTNLFTENCLSIWLQDYIPVSTAFPCTTEIQLTTGN